MSHYDPPILVSSAITMQRIAQAVSQHGYRHWIGGTVAADKAIALASKMDARYGLSLSTPQRYRAALAGQSVALMWLYPLADSTALRWLVLRRDGTLPASDDEHWQDARHHRERIEWGGYELIRLPYTRAQRAAYEGRGLSPDKANSWTWQMTRSAYQGHERRIRSGVSALKKTGSRVRLEQALHSLARAPGFRRVREQVFALRLHTSEEMKQARLPAHVWGPMPPYLRARKCSEFPLSVVVARVRRNEPSWFPPPPRGTPSGAITHTGYRQDSNHAETIDAAQDNTQTDPTPCDDPTT